MMIIELHMSTRNLPSHVAKRIHWKEFHSAYAYLRLAIEPARLGSAQLELARYGNELARLGSITKQAKILARLGSFASSSWLI